MLAELDKLTKHYDDFTRQISATHWRFAGHFYMELKKMRDHIESATEITVEELSIPWIKESLERHTEEKEEKE